MELSVLIEPTVGAKFRASSGDPLPAAAEGATREEALDNLRSVLGQRVRDGAEVVRLRLSVGNGPPVCPDDGFTREWLAGIASARKAADASSGADPS